MSEGENGPLAIVGGTSLLKSNIFSSLAPTAIETEHGTATVYTGKSSTGKEIVFLQRHHANEDASTYQPPHKIDHRRSFAALVALKVSRIVAVCSVGGLHKAFPPSSLVLPDDYFYLFGPPVSFHDDARGHIVPVIDSGLRSKVAAVLSTGDGTAGLTTAPATYVQTTGPRFETKAEVKFLGTLGDVIGMTGASEATMAAELKLPYAIIAMVDNFANGAAEEALTAEAFHDSVKGNQATVESAVEKIIADLA
eukprot:Plantae.Rhodophyta-Palmaria_palmata.ctg4555.p1 GENE.Plantae.Rhodophyta-Palmaria_palmata.ctg4555~~Plantae.Rhodophyta-Palmaria_palmata.ctg4555.p1  ORF type:complete len:252 (-),score=44.10 Plantae.Rhodophyta-Palmaria_palmata.ctg4555:664-1419(-)